MSRCHVSCVGTYHCNISSTYNVNIFWNFYNSVWGLPSLYQFSVRRLTSQVGPVYATRWIFYIEILLQCFFVCMLLRVMCLFIFQTSFQFFGFQRYFMIILTWLEGANSWSLIKYKLNVFTPFNSRRGQQLYVLWLPELTGLQDKWDFYFSKSALYLLAGRQRIVIRQAAGQEGALTDLLKWARKPKMLRFWCWGWDLWENVLVIPSGNYYDGKV